MRKPTRNHKNRIKRKNQSLRIKRKNSNNTPLAPFRRRRIEGEICKDTIGLYTRHIWPNQAQHSVL